jgi:hypothetical protein
MGRSFESVRQGVQRVADRWARSSRALKKEDQQYGEKLVQMAKKHSSEVFVGCNDPLEAAVFSALVEMLKHLDEVKSTPREGERISWNDEKSHSIVENERIASEHLAVRTEPQLPLASFERRSPVCATDPGGMVKREF